MDLPDNIDLIVGMDFMRAHDVITHRRKSGPIRTKPLVMGQQKKAPNTARRRLVAGPLK